MLSPEFDSINHDLGRECLEHLGFKYENSNWHYLCKDWQLSFILGKDKNASHFQVKYLTVAIRHSQVPMGDDRVKLVPYSDIDKGSPIKISPNKLRSYAESGYSDSAWHYVNSSERHPNEYQPIYYGGLDTASSETIVTLGGKIISEEVAIEELRNAMKNVGEYALLWAQKMTPQEIVRQISEHGKGWWVENQWVKAYNETFLS